MISLASTTIRTGLNTRILFIPCSVYFPTLFSILNDLISYELFAIEFLPQGWLLEEPEPSQVVRPYPRVLLKVRYADGAGLWPV